MDTLPDAPRLIGLGGFARSGKDATANALARYGYRRIAFADPLYEIVADLNVTVFVRASGGPMYAMNPYHSLNTLVAEHGWAWVKEHAPQGRATLDALGAGIRRYEPDFWIRTALAPIEADPQARFVVTDCRFPVEADAVKALGGRFVRVVRPGVGPKVDPVTGRPSPYETSMTNYPEDAVVDNGGDLSDLDAAVRTVLSGL